LYATASQLQKTALVVDDSRTARVILSRMLENHDLQVDTAESAEQALEHLRHHRPNVIFMDHMMPGMDGLQAVQEIKKDPRTATIPILMYTAKQGEVYMGEARALGAVGILSKQVRPAEVFEVLLGLGLVTDRRERTAELRDGNASVSELFADEEHEQPEPPPPTPVVQPAVDMALLRSSIAELMDDYLHRYRQEMTGVRDAVEKGYSGALDLAVDRIHEDLQTQKALVETLTTTTASAKRQSRLFRWPIALSLLLAGVVVWLFVRSVDLDNSLAQAATREELLLETVTWAMNLDGEFDFDAPAFGEEALARMHELVTRLRWAGFKGTLRLEGHVGRFCLSGDSTTGFAAATPDLPASQCSQVGQSAEIAIAMGEAMSGGFSDYLDRFEMEGTHDIVVAVVSLGDEVPKRPYPKSASDVTAGEWNEIAQQNQRVEVHLLPE
jgi:CheY-like chemotaxis protein